MNKCSIIPLFDFSGGVVITIVSIVVGLGIIVGLILYIAKSRKKRKMVHNRPKKNDQPENLG